MKNRFEVLYEIGQVLNSILDIDELLVKAMDIVVQHTYAERGFILISDIYSEEKDSNKFVASNFEIKIARNMKSETIKETISKTVIKEIFKNKKPVLSFDARLDPRFKTAQSILFKQVVSIACVPLIMDSELRGIIYVDSSTKRKLFTQDTLDFLILFSNMAAVAIKNATLHTSLEKEHALLKKATEFGEIVGSSSEMQVVFDAVKKAASVDCPVLIQGESGTGKELIARAVHYNSDRKRGKFVPLYCGGLPETIIESELYGHKKGAFTGATGDKEGLFEAANKGTLFFDEVCDIPLSIQVKLLRTLQLGEIRRVGETSMRKVNVRVLSSTNKDIFKEISAKRFREDLYYRLNVLNIKIPPLRKRKEDISLLVPYFLKMYGEKWGKRNLVISNSLMNKLIANPWRGNIRELENVVQRLIVTSNTNPITEEAISFQVKSSDPRTFEEIEKSVILKRLEEFGGNRTKAAKSLGISLRTLFNKLKKWENLK